MCLSRNYVNCVAFKPDNPNIVVSGSDDKTIKTWDITSGSCLSTLRGHSKDNEECTCKHHGLNPWDYKANPDCPVTGHTDRVTGVCFDPTGKTIVSCSWDKTIRFWDSATGAAIGSPVSVGGEVSRAGEEEEEYYIHTMSVDWSKCGNKISAACKNLIDDLADDSYSVKIFSKEGSTGNVWNIATGEEKTEALPGSKFALSKEKGNLKQQVGRFVCTAEDDLLLIYLLQAEDDAKGGARRPVAFFRAPSPILALDCQGAEIALGCHSGAVLLLRAAVLLT